MRMLRAAETRLCRLRIETIDSDGNCLFRAIADQLFGDPEQHEEVRRQIVDHMEENRAHFECFCEEDFDEYCARLRQDGEWGGG